MRDQNKNKNHNCPAHYAQLKKIAPSRNGRKIFVTIYGTTSALPLSPKLISTFSLFSVFSHDISCIDFAHITLQTQQLMTPQIRSHIKYLMQTHNILCSFCDQNWWKI